MKTYRIDFMVNGKVNRHGYLVQAPSILSAVERSFHELHIFFDGVVDSFEIISASVETGS